MRRGSEATSTEPWEPVMLSSEPCGSLPVVTFSVSAHYCEHHMAWSCSWMAYREVDADRPERLGGATMRFGPFDREDEVRAWMLRAVLAMDDLTP
jgi:hypothetical protein